MGELRELPSELPVVAFRVIDGIAWVRSRDYQRAVDLVVELEGERDNALELLRAEDPTFSLTDSGKRVIELEAECKTARRDALNEAAAVVENHMSGTAPHLEQRLLEMAEEDPA